MPNELARPDIQLTLDRYERALRAIVEKEGRLCPDFHVTGCAHPGCLSSYYAWIIANDALHPFHASPNTPSESAKP